MKYKVGDKVRIKSKEWWDAQPKTARTDVDCGEAFFNSYMTDMCGEVVEISDISGNCYKIKGDLHYWTDEMLEGLAEDKPALSDFLQDIANVIKNHNMGVQVSESEGKLIIEPLKVEEDLPIDTPCMAKSDNNDEWRLRYYAGKCKCYICGGKSNNEDATSSWDCIIPCDKFNFENPKESLKYNIVK